MSKSRALSIALVETYLLAAIGLIGSVIVSRKLSPHDIGLFQLASVCVALIATVRDLGLTGYIIQEKDLTQEKMRSILGLNLALSAGLAVLLFAASWPLSSWFREVEIGTLLRILSLNFLLIPFGALSMAVLRRNLDFASLFKITIASAVVSLLVSLAGIYAGWRHYALVWGAVAGNCCTVLCAFLYRPDNLPYRPSFVGWREPFNFGVHAISIYAMSTFTRVFPEQWIGRFLGPASVAYYSRGGSLLEICNQLFGRVGMSVALPLLAAAARANQPIAPSATLATGLLTAIGWSVLAFVGALAFPLIVGLFGWNWAASVPLGQLLCVVLFIEVPLGYYKEALTSVGQIKAASALQLKVMVLRIVGFGVGMVWGLYAAIGGSIIASIISMGLVAMELRRLKLIQVRQMCPIVIKSGIVAVGVGLVAFSTYLLLQRTVGQSTLPQLAFAVLCVPTSALAWFALMIGTKHPSLNLFLGLIPSRWRFWNR